MKRIVLISILVFVSARAAAQVSDAEFEAMKADMKAMRTEMAKYQKEVDRVRAELTASKDSVALAIKNIQESENSACLTVSAMYLAGHYDDARAEAALKKGAEGKKSFA